MKISWARIFREHGVPYIESGNHVKKGNINICCPFCASDQKFFMGVDPASGFWGCWWSKDHRGKSPIRLLMRLLRVSYERAREIAGLGDSYIDPDGYDSLVAKLRNPDTAQRPQDEKPDHIRFDREFRHIEPKGATFRFWDYLDRRGFDDIADLCDTYQLRCAISGDFKDRVVIPFIVNGSIVSWTARAIGSSSLRYRDLELDRSAVDPKTTLYNIDAGYEGGEALIVVEGQFDVMKLDYYGREFGVRAVGISTKSFTDSQIYLLEEVLSLFNRRIFMLDTKNKLDFVETLSLAGGFSHVRGIESMPVPYGYKDCGEMPPGRIRAFCKRLLQGGF